MITIEINIYSLKPIKIELTTNKSIKGRKCDTEIISLE